MPQGCGAVFYQHCWGTLLLDLKVVSDPSKTVLDSSSFVPTLPDLLLMPCISALFFIPELHPCSAGWATHDMQRLSVNVPLLCKLSQCCSLCNHHMLSLQSCICLMQSLLTMCRCFEVLSLAGGRLSSTVQGNFNPHHDRTLISAKDQRDASSYFVHMPSAAVIMCRCWRPWPLQRDLLRCRTTSSQTTSGC